MSSGRRGSGNRSRRNGRVIGDPSMVRRNRLARLPWGRMLRWTAILAVAVAGVLAPRYAPPLLGSMDAFRADEVDIEGARFLDRAEAVKLAAVDPATSVWDDLEPIRARVATHPLLQSVSIRRDLPDRIVLTVIEREPIGLVPTPTLEPIDQEGRYLPLDPAGLPLDLPLLIPMAGPADTTVHPSSARIRRLAVMAETLRAEPEFWSRLSELRETEEGIVAQWGGDPDVVFQLGESIDLRRIQEGVAALGHAMAQSEERTPRMVDLRWADQVVIRYPVR